MKFDNNHVPVEIISEEEFINKFKKDCDNDIDKIEKYIVNFNKQAKCDSENHIVMHGLYKKSYNKRLSKTVLIGICFALSLSTSIGLAANLLLSESLVGLSVIGTILSGIVMGVSYNEFIKSYGNTVFLRNHLNLIKNSNGNNNKNMANIRNAKIKYNKSLEANTGKYDSKNNESELNITQKKSQLISEKEKLLNIKEESSNINNNTFRLKH